MALKTDVFIKTGESDEFSFGTIEAAQDFLIANFEEGAHCPCCGRLVKLYRHAITRGMAHILILIYGYFQREDAKEWLDVAPYLNAMGNAERGGNFAKLEAWGLLERCEGERDDGSSRIGKWRITPHGKAFVERKIRIPRRRCFYDQMHLAFLDNDQESPWITIDEALKNKFDYDRLMKGIA